MARVLMIGLDAASLPFIERSAAALQNLRRLLDTGAPQRIRPRSSEIFPASVWPTFFTGTQPDDHGVYYPLQWDAASMSLKPALDLLYCEPFWYDLERRPGLKLRAGLNEKGLFDYAGRPKPALQAVRRAFTRTG